MLETPVLIAGGGPAGALAALILARAGARVRVFERARFPRHKLCGDTLNPGALAVLSRHLDTADLLASSDDIHGMLITGPGGVAVRATYGAGMTGRAVTRRVLDALSRAAHQASVVRAACDCAANGAVTPPNARL